MGNNCQEHSAWVKEVVEIKTDIKWLRKDREEQKIRYEQEQRRIVELKKIELANRRLFFTIGFTITSTILGAIWDKIDLIKIAIQRWLDIV